MLQAGVWKDHPKSRLRRSPGDLTSGISSIGSSIISYSKGIPLADFASTSAPSYLLLLLIRRPVTNPVLHSGGNYHFLRTHTYSNLPIRPYLLDGAIGYYDNLYEVYGPFMTVRTTPNKHITSQDLAYLKVEGASEV